MPPTKKFSPTIRDVARQAGVSVATVSRVINRNTPVSDEAAARVLATMAELKFVPQAAARSLASKKTHTIALLLTDIGGDFFAPILSGIEKTTRQAAYDLLISTSGRLKARDEFPPSLGPHNTDGILVFANCLSEAGLVKAHQAGFPIVLIHQSPPAGLSIPCVTVENKAASRKIIEHLIQAHNRRRIVFLRGPQGNEDSAWRELGYREALLACGLTIDPQLVAAGEFDRDTAQASLARLLANGVVFDAVFTGDDEAAVGALAALRQAGLRVPEDVSVVGFDDQRMAAYLTPPLSTVRAPTQAVGEAAAEQLLRLIRTGQAEHLTLLPAEIVVRRSCGCLE
ncbi:MAG TPA: LacI family DNA-binding transcriptional regulator [Anaerolineales bacterium]